MQNKTERRPFSLARYCMLRGKKGKTFLVQFPGPTGTFFPSDNRLYAYWTLFTELLNLHRQGETHLS